MDISWDLSTIPEAVIIGQAGDNTFIIATFVEPIYFPSVFQIHNYTSANAKYFLNKRKRNPYDFFALKIVWYYCTSDTMTSKCAGGTRAYKNETSVFG